MPGKSPNAFRTISEVSSELDLPQHVLRFWETRFPQVKPIKRGGGRRYYRPEDVDLLHRIRSLLYDDGYTIKGVQKLLRQGDAGRGTAPALAAETRDEAALDGDKRAQLAAIQSELEDMRAILAKAAS